MLLLQRYNNREVYCLLNFLYMSIFVHGWVGAFMLFILYIKVVRLVLVVSFFQNEKGTKLANMDILLFF